MRKILRVFYLSIVLFLLFGCKDAKKQKEIMDYVNIDCVMLGEIETKMLNSYNSVFGANYVSDEIAYEEISNNTMNYIRELNIKAIEVAQKYINNQEVSEVHNVLLQCTTNYLNAISYIQTALETQNREMIIKANNELSSANSSSVLWRSKLNELCEKYKIVLKFK